LPEVYAKEAIALFEEPRRELKLQAIRIGELGIAAIPNEVFAITGLKIKAQSPFETTMNIDLANGSEGYIPPPEQHILGGYTTWPARTAGLEIQAEPRILAATLELLEKIAQRPRRPLRVVAAPYSQAVLASRPLAYWRLDEIQGPAALDSSGNAHHAGYEGGVAFFLPGKILTGPSALNPINRAAHFAGGRLRAELAIVGENYSIELWFWNGVPNDVRSITGCLISIGKDGTGKTAGHLFIGGTDHAPGCLCFADGDPRQKRLFGKTKIAAKTWHHIVLTHRPGHLVVYLDGNPEPEIAGATQIAAMGRTAFLFIGAGSGGFDNFEGKTDEVAVYGRLLPVDEIVKHVRAAR
jgi:hypothetical protein